MRNGRVHLVVVVAVALAVGFAGSLGAELARVLALECAPCGMKFESGAEKARHDISAHGAEGCLKCGVVYDDAKVGDTHSILRHDAEGCRSCDVEFRSREDALGHLVAEHECVRCGDCGQVFEGEAEAAEHAKKCVPPQEPAVK
jgi:uncharacterized C2H2 Zn-finger protein